MQKNRWQQIEQIFNEASQLDGSERDDYLRKTCCNDLELEAEVVSLLEEDTATNDFLADPIFETGFKLLTDEEEQVIFAPGDRINSYQILELIGTGGLSQVYLALDEGLGRKVAIKLLRPKSESFGISVEQLQREARLASAVNHPNVAHIYRLEIHENYYFIVMEYVAGETLRQIIRREALPLHRASRIAAQIAEGLAAAHGLGVIHRDIKPENIIIQSDDYVKILDFGLAKFINDPLTLATSVSGEISKADQALLLGTPQYMSPEQIQSHEIHPTTDIWSLGVVIYEMITREHPFDGLTIVALLNAVLYQDIRSNRVFEAPGAAVLEEIIQHCLAKKPAKRFQSAMDLAFALETFYIHFNPNKRQFKRRRSDVGIRGWWRNLTTVWRFSAIFLVIAAFGSALLPSLIAFKPGVLEKGKATTFSNRQPVYQQTTFQRGTVWSARFLPDNASIIYAATWNGNKIKLFTTRAGSHEFQPLNFTDTNLLDVSVKGELALLKNKKYLYQFLNRGVLIRMSLNGDLPKEIAEDVLEADWSPDGENLAIVRWVDGKHRLEYPIGNVLYETSGYLNNLRISPKNDFIAFADHPKQWDNRGYISKVDLQGNKEILTDEWSGIEGLAWNPLTSDIWFTASRNGDTYSLYAVTGEKQLRVVARAPAHLMLYDIATDGRALISRATQTIDIFGTSPKYKAETNFSWLNQIGIADFANDGTSYLLTNFGAGAGTNYGAHLKNTDQSQPIRLGEGRALALSPDKRFAIAKINQPEDRLVILPVGSGEKLMLPRGDIETYDKAVWFPDSGNILFTGNRTGEGKCTFSQNITTGEITQLTSPGITGYHLSPDGKKLVVYDLYGAPLQFNLVSGKSEPIKNLLPEETVAGWADDNQSLFVFRSLELPISICRLNISTGHKELFKEIRPSNPSGAFGVPYVFVTPDAKHYLYGLRRYMFEMYVVDNLTEDSAGT